jgi:tRNA dimethylallyltransferase
MIDVADPDTDFDVTKFQKMGRRIVESIVSGGGRTVIVGGSGLHFRSIVDPYSFAPTEPTIRRRLESNDAGMLVDALLRIDERAVEHVDLGNQRRVVRALEIWELTGETPSDRAESPESQRIADYTAVIPHVSLGFDAGATSHERADARFDKMMDAGLLAEIEGLRGHLGRAASQAVGYKELLPVVSGSAPLDQAIEAAKSATHGLIKRQRTFFGRDPRITWLTWQDDADNRIASAVEAVERIAGWTS